MTTTDLTGARRQVLRRLSTELRRETHVLEARPDLLWQQVANRLQHADPPMERLSPRLVEQQRTRSTAPARPWLRLRTDVYEPEALVRTLAGHTAPVTSCRFLPDGRILSASVDRTARVWSVVGSVDHVLAGHRQAIEACDASPDGTRIVTASSDGLLKLWDAVTGDELTSSASHDGPVICCAFTPDGRVVVSGGKDTACHLWDLGSGRVVAFPAHSTPVTSVAVHPGGEHVASTSSDEVLVWDRRDLQVVRRLRGLPGVPTASACSRGGRWLAAGSWEGAITIWDLDSGSKAVTLPRGPTVTAIDWFGDDSHLVSTDVSGSVRLWDLGGSAERGRLQGHADPVEGCACNGDTSLVVSAGDDALLKVWDVRIAMEPQRRQQQGSRGARSCAAMADGAVLVATDDALTHLDATDLAASQLRRLQPGQGRGLAYAFAPDRRVVAIGHRSGELWLHPLQGAGAPRQLATDDTWVTSCAFSRDGRLLAAGSRRGTLRVWDLDRDEESLSVVAHAERVTACAISPDATRVASGSWDETVRIRDLRTGETLLTLGGHTDKVTGCAFTPDGRRILTASEDRTLRLWDATSGAVVWANATTGAIRCCDVSATGALVVAGGDDGTVSVRDAQAGREVARFAGVGPITTCSLAPRGRTLCCTGEGGELYVLELVGSVR